MDNVRGIYDKNTLEFVTVVLEYCTWLERAAEYDLFGFVGHAVKLLPLLYLKATLLPELDEPNEMEDIPQFVTEETYQIMCSRLSDKLGEHDSYLETFLPDMQYSDSPIVAFISENLGDIYQDLGDFVAVFREGNEQTMLLALQQCAFHFRLFWGQTTLNALRALHALCYNQEEQ